MKAALKEKRTVETSQYSVENMENENVFSPSMVQMWEGNNEFGIVRARDPIPEGRDDYYFQVKINHLQNEQSTIHIGLSTKDFVSPPKSFENLSVCSCSCRLYSSRLVTDLGLRIMLSSKLLSFLLMVLRTGVADLKL